jgi:TatD DNase family protein
LDYYRQDATPANQDTAFRAFLDIAKRHDLPVLIHCRNAYEELLRVLGDARHGRLRGVMHCASGPPEFIRGALALGFHISFAGNITFPNAQALRELVPLVPDERLLIETDAPFLAPQPVRGMKNEPAFVAHTAAHLAQLRGISVEELGAITTRNAQALLGLT